MDCVKLHGRSKLIQFLIIFFATDKDRQALGMTIQDASFTTNVIEGSSDDYTLATTTSKLSTLTKVLAAQSKKIKKVLKK